MVKDAYSLKWAPRSKKDLKEIYNYIKERDTNSALYVVNTIRQKAKEATFYPTKGPIEPTINEERVRFLIKWSYKIIYEIKTDHILVLRVFHMSQNPNKLIN
ncbi:MAG: type II toxin-antitoxin system RelE/ParE family toxin [Candidatus Symbiothrix sp.]|jgi:plasmid stabilization system protein ParE|nr:type II toxin-antitoxin system RelE/ParE family toxin [Candidatus Symbiothrix sp.]